MFKLKIETDNAAFAENMFPELARILREVAMRLENKQSDAGICRDINGNTVGEWLIDP